MLDIQNSQMLFRSLYTNSGCPRRRLESRNPASWVIMGNIYEEVSIISHNENKESLFSFFEDF